jgi:hypothetical protein
MVRSRHHTAPFVYSWSYSWTVASLARDDTDSISTLADCLPVREEFNRKRQMIRAVTCIAILHWL